MMAILKHQSAFNFIATIIVIIVLFLLHRYHHLSESLDDVDAIGNPKDSEADIDEAFNITKERRKRVAQSIAERGPGFRFNSSPIPPLLPPRLRIKIRKATNLYRSEKINIWSAVSMFSKDEFEYYGNHITSALQGIKYIEYADRGLTLRQKQIRNKRSASSTDMALINIYDCQSGHIERNKDVTNCLDSKVCKFSYISILYYQLKAHGIAVEYFLIKTLAAKFILYNDEIYLLTCPRKSGLIINNGLCYSDGIRPVLVQNRTKFITRNGFITSTYGQVQCKDKTDREAVIHISTFYIALMSSLALVANNVFYRFHNPTLINRLFNTRDAGSLIYLEESYLSNVDQNSLTCHMLVTIRRISPYLVSSFTAFKVITSIVLFVLGIIKKLPCLKAMTLCIPALKKIHDYQKIRKEHQKDVELAMLKAHRLSMGRNPETSFSEVSTDHLQILYQTNIDLKLRLNLVQADVLEIKERMGISSLASISMQNTPRPRRIEY